MGQVSLKGIAKHNGMVGIFENESTDGLGGVFLDASVCISWNG